MKKQALVVSGIENVRAARILGVEVQAERMGAEVLCGGSALVITLEGDGAALGINQIAERLKESGDTPIPFSRCTALASGKPTCGDHVLGTKTAACANCHAAVAFYKP